MNLSCILMVNIPKDVKVYKTPVCTLGVLDINIPYLHIGSGLPIVSLVTGIHGNETSSLFVVNELLHRLHTTKGTLNIIIGANPLALSENTRISNVDRLDLNRIFPGDMMKSITHKIAHAIVGIIKHSQVVIDIHSFDMETPLLGIILQSENKAQQERNKQLMQQFSPKQVWMINTQQEPQYGTALGVVLNELNIPNIAVELDMPESINQQQVLDCVAGIFRVLHAQGMITQEIMPSTTFDVLDRTVITAEHSGIFVPQIKPEQTVQVGDILGVLKILPLFHDTPIISTKKGVVMQVLRRKFVLPGQELAAIGTTWEERL